MLAARGARAARHRNPPHTSVEYAESLDNFEIRNIHAKTTPALQHTRQWAARKQQWADGRPSAGTARQPTQERGQICQLKAELARSIWVRLGG